MASTSKQTKKTTASARATAGNATETARVAAGTAERNLRSMVRESAYATLGAGDLAVSVVRNLGEKAAQLRAEAPRTIRTGVDPREVGARLERRLDRVRSGATVELDRLSRRGRTLVEGLQHSSTTRKAAEQVGNARSQVKAATTSVGRAARFVGHAAGDTAASVGDDQETPVDYERMTLDELKEMARARQISGRSSMNRDELVAALRAE